MEAGHFAAVQVAEALAKGGIKIVPDIVAGGSDGASGGLVSVLLGNMIHQDHVSRQAARSKSDEKTDQG